MKVFLLLVMLMTSSALPVLAGQGTIEETDTAIVVEYTGDPGDKQPDSRHSTMSAPAHPAESVENVQIEAPVPAAPEEETPPPTPQGEQQL